jgi:DisA bacterial checkpoint controller nucleotide-binding
MLDPKFTEEILNAWRDDQGHPHRGRSQRSLPPTVAVSRFLDTCFLATLRDEEGQPVKFSVALSWDQKFDSMVGPTMHQPLKLQSATEFSDSSLAKLAPAFDPVLSTILVTWNEEKLSLEYWGIWLHAQGHNRFSEVPVGVVGSANFRPDFLTLISKGRAALSIARGGSLIGTLQAGYFKRATPTPFTSKSLGQYVHASISADPIFASVGNTYWHYVRDALDLLLSEASLRGHGGTVVLLPSGSSLAHSHYTSKYRLDGTYSLRETFQRCIQTEDHMEIAIAHRKVANESIQRISQLAAVDGALILTFEFDVLAFGSTLTAPRTASRAMIGPDGFGQVSQSTFDIDRYGTRHRSAMDFVASVPDAIAFVISQDGPIRAFRSAGNAIVHVWPDCTSSMFV